MKKKSTSLDLTPISVAEIEANGGRPRRGGAPRERGHDLLGRHLIVPNRMMVLYSSEDVILARYIRDHWAALDSISGDVCEIYPSLLQLSGGEDIYSFIRSMKNIPGSETIRLDKLPMFLLWSNSAAISISLRELSGDTDRLRNLFRDVFQFLHELGRPLDIDSAPAFESVMKKTFAHTNLGPSYFISVDRRISVKTTKVDRGGVLLMKGTKARDIKTKTKTSTSRNSQSVDLGKLADDLVKLRNAMRAAARSDNDTEHDIAIGQVAVAETAAKAGDRKKTMAALKAAGSFALEVAEKIGVSVASAAIKSGIGLPSA